MATFDSALDAAPVDGVALGFEKGGFGENGESDSVLGRVGATGKIGAFDVIVPLGTYCRYNLPNRKKKLRQNLKKTARRR